MEWHSLVWSTSAATCGPTQGSSPEQMSRHGRGGGNRVAAPNMDGVGPSGSPSPATWANADVEPVMGVVPTAAVSAMAACSTPSRRAWCLLTMGASARRGAIGAGDENAFVSDT